MKILIWFLIIFSISLPSVSQQPAIKNLVIVTTDGFRWQEVFHGADSALLFNNGYVRDTGLMKSLYWATTPEERRARLMPFLWHYAALHGQLWGNRSIGSSVSVDNPYRLSYAGYHEMLTGFTDMSIKTNRARPNGNDNLLSFFARQPAFRGKVAAFCSWKVFRQIIENSQGQIILNAGYHPFDEEYISQSVELVNSIQQNSRYRHEATRADMLTFTMAMEYMREKHPRILFISLGETDEYAHQGRYDRYLQQANQVDRMLSEIWLQIQQDEFYRGSTQLFVTTDHGRGSKPSQWGKHGALIKGSDQTWLMRLGTGVEALGETGADMPIQNIQFAQSMAQLFGLQFTANNHPVAESFLPESMDNAGSGDAESRSGSLSIK